MRHKSKISPLGGNQFKMLIETLLCIQTKKLLTFNFYLDLSSNGSQSKWIKIIIWCVTMSDNDDDDNYNVNN